MPRFDRPVDGGDRLHLLRAPVNSLMPMQPRPIADTSGPFRPQLCDARLVFIFVSSVEPRANIRPHRIFQGLEDFLTSVVGPQVFLAALAA